MNKPLTLGQLREMDGKVCRAVFYDVEPLEMLVLVEVVKNAGCVILRNNLGGCSEYYSDDEIREDGLKFYTYPPAHIDREAWEPCQICKSCSSCKYSLESVYRIEDTCFFCNNQDKYEARKFCPECGRPLTEEAWEELEKRVRGENGTSNENGYK